jgi:hypothetical protein
MNTAMSMAECQEKPAQDAESQSMSSVDSLPGTTASTLSPVTCSIPVNADGMVPSGLSIYISRRGKAQEPRGFVFSIDRNHDLTEGFDSAASKKGGASIGDSKDKDNSNNNQPVEIQEVMFGSAETCIAKGSRNEITFLRSSSSPTPADINNDTKLNAPTSPEIGSINFHHWILDRSRNVIVTNSTGFATNLRRSAACGPHHFTLPSSTELYWQETRTVYVPASTTTSEEAAKGEEGGEEEEEEEMKNVDGQYRHRILKRSNVLQCRNLKCVDAEGRIYASYARAPDIWCTGKRVGHFHLLREGLTPDEVETLLMTLLAVYVKLRKRFMQASVAAYAGGLVTLGMYAVQG